MFKAIHCFLLRGFWTEELLEVLSVANMRANALRVKIVDPIAFHEVHMPCHHTRVVINLHFVQVGVR